MLLDKFPVVSSHDIPLKLTNKEDYNARIYYDEIRENHLRFHEMDSEMETVEIDSQQQPPLKIKIFLHAHSS